MRVRIHVSIKLMGAPQTCTHKSRGSIACTRTRTQILNVCAHTPKNQAYSDASTGVCTHVIMHAPCACACTQPACILVSNISCMRACIHRDQGARGGQPHGPAVMKRLASARHNCEKVLSTVTFHSKYTISLNFQNFSQGMSQVSMSPKSSVIPRPKT